VDIGGYQLAARMIPADLMVFLGGTTYIKGQKWLERIVEAYEKHGRACTV